MSKIIFLVTFISLFVVSGQFATVDAQSEPTAAQATDTQPLVLPLVYRTPGARALLLTPWPAEADPIKKVLLANKIKVDQRETIDLKRKDYSEYHLIIGTSNVMDLYGYEQNPADFDPMERFVAEGGHLLLFGTFNGRNSKNLSRFGIVLGTAHGHGFRRIPGRTELLLNGFESIIPKEDKVTSAGNFDVSAPHVVLLKRGASDYLPEQPAIATLAYKKGRVTYTQIEPSWQGDEWMLPVMATWAVRGGPTIAEQLDQNVVLDERTLIERRKLLVPSESELQAAQQALREKLKDDIASAFTPEDKLKLAVRLVEMSRMEISPAVAFAGLQLAREFYAESSNPIGVFDAIRQLQSEFQYDTSQIALETAKSLAEKAQDPVSAVEFVKVCLDLADDLTASGRYDAAVSIVELAKNAAQIAKHKHYQSMVTSLTRRLGVLQKESQLIQTFRDTLKATPDNPEANLEVGKFQCLIVRDWETGLPQLALGSDVALRQLAEGELKKTEDPTAQAILADLWAAQSKKLPAAMRSAAGSRAKLWYWRAISKSSGAQRTTLEKKASKIITPKFELRFSISKSEQSQLVISPGRLIWKSSTPPTSIEVNSQYWPIETMSELRNFGATRYMSEEVNFETAALTPVRVRGRIKLASASPEEVVIDIDTHDDSEFVVKFGP